MCLENDIKVRSWALKLRSHRIKKLSDIALNYYKYSKAPLSLEQTNLFYPQNKLHVYLSTKIAIVVYLDSHSSSVNRP